MLRTGAEISASVRHCEAPLWRRSNPESTPRTLDCFAARRAPLAMTFEALIFPAVLKPTAGLIVVLLCCRSAFLEHRIRHWSLP